MILGWLALGYGSDPISWFQKKIYLPDEKVKLSSGKLVDLILWCLPDTTKRHHQWKGLLGRKHPNSITEPPTNGKCLHPDQNRLCYQFYSSTPHKHGQIVIVVPPPLAYICTGDETERSVG
ncbi:hypothetical protein POM88_027333 [Heracleum sosnowskyi]|uniref:Uncharacterized protein n=1 Tax=Heracleum sosnowskyi TaxID=360622 RepID=A0AAD8I7K8_9APIA|nr:hypothetical protein POM88_027333 [Heracleum sosnowskyi]